MSYPERPKFGEMREVFIWVDNIGDETRYKVPGKIAETWGWDKLFEFAEMVAAIEDQDFRADAYIMVYHEREARDKAGGYSRWEEIVTEWGYDAQDGWRPLLRGGIAACIMPSAQRARRRQKKEKGIFHRPAVRVGGEIQ